MTPAPQSAATQANDGTYLDARRRAGGLLPAPLAHTAAASAASLHYASSIAPTEASRNAPIPPLPKHWDAPRYLIPRLIFGILCLAAVGSPHLYEVWWWSSYRQVAFNEGVAKIRERITTVTVVAGLILSATAALVTTTPPRVDILNYNARGPYILILFSLAISLGGLVAGSVSVYVLSGTIEKDWARDVLCSNRSKVVCFLILLGYPFFSIGVSTIMTALGLLISAFASSDRLVQICGAFALALPVSGAPLVWYIHHQPGARARQIRRWKHRIERRSGGHDAHLAEDIEAQQSAADDSAEEKVGDMIMEVNDITEDERYTNNGAHGRVSFEVPKKGPEMEV